MLFKVRFHFFSPLIRPYSLVGLTLTTIIIIIIFIKWQSELYDNNKLSRRTAVHYVQATSAGSHSHAKYN